MKYVCLRTPWAELARRAGVGARARAPRAPRRRPTGRAVGDDPVGCVHRRPARRGAGAAGGASERWARGGWAGGRAGGALRLRLRLRLPGVADAAECGRCPCAWRCAARARRAAARRVALCRHLARPPRSCSHRSRPRARVRWRAVQSRDRLIAGDASSAAAWPGRGRRRASRGYFRFSCKGREARGRARTRPHRVGLPCVVLNPGLLTGATPLHLGPRAAPRRAARQGW